MQSSTLERQKRILKYLDQEDAISNRDLMKRLRVTAMTIWRDLSSLEEQGMVKRQRGRVVRAASSRLIEPHFNAKRDRAYDAKQRISRYAAEKFLHEGDTVAIDGGTTVALLAGQTLPSQLTIFTNSLHTAQLMMQHPAHPNVYCCGGLLREKSGTFIGREAWSFFTKRRVDRYFLSASGVDASAGITDLTLEDNEVKQAMTAASQQVVLLADQSKIGLISHMRVIPWKCINHLISDASDKQLRTNGLTGIKSIKLHSV